MKATVLERDLRALLRDESRFPFGTVTFTEFAMGGDAGAPDSWIAALSHAQPVELKRGKSALKGLRPSQKQWHLSCAVYGVRTYGLAIDTTGTIRLFRMCPRGVLDEELLVLTDVDGFNYNWFCSALKSAD